MDLKLIKDMTPIYSSIKERVGIYKDNDGNTFVVKKSHLHKEKLNSIFAENEALVLRSLLDLNVSKRLFPVFVKVEKKDNYINLVTKPVPGKRLDLLNKQTRTKIIKEIYKELIKLSAQSKKDDFRNLPFRNPLSYLMSFPVNLVRLIVKNPKEISDYLRVGFLFYFYYLSSILSKVSIGLAHRDLWPDNILYSKEDDTITLLDWESAAVTDSLYDLSQIVMIYSRDFGSEKIIEFLKDCLETNSERQRLLGLSLFNCVQMLANIKKEDKVFKQLSKFVATLKNQIAPAILYKKSPFEFLNGCTLNLISYFYKITGLSINDRNKKLVLCYHSVGNDGWRFSTRVKAFESHLKTLKSLYKFSSLSNLLNGSEGGIHISFDDGYENISTNALPLLKKNNVTATVFVLGHPESANRKELDNSLPLMNKDQILRLKKEGWEIGFHTRTHPYVNNLNDLELQKEIILGKKDLENELGFKIKYFAYPKGAYSKKIVSCVKKAKYTAAFTVDGNEVLTKATNKLLLDRVPIDGELTTSQLTALLSPIGLMVTKIFFKTLVLKEKYLTFHRIKLFI